MEVNIHDFRFINDFLYMIAKLQGKRGKIDKLNFIKIKCICVPEDTETQRYSISKY